MWTPANMATQRLNSIARLIVETDLLIQKMKRNSSVGDQKHKTAFQHETEMT